MNDRCRVTRVLDRDTLILLFTDALLHPRREKLCQWQAEEQDAGSVVSDPGFRDPAGRDFFPGPDAAAVAALGFQPFRAQIGWVPAR